MKFGSGSESSLLSSTKIILAVGFAVTGSAFAIYAVNAEIREKTSRAVGTDFSGGAPDAPIVLDGIPDKAQDIDYKTTSVNGEIYVAKIRRKGSLRWIGQSCGRNPDRRKFSRDLPKKLNTVIKFRLWATSPVEYYINTTTTGTDANVIMDELVFSIPSN